MLAQNLGGQTKSNIVFSEVAYCIFVLDKRYNESNMVKLSSTDLNQIEERAFLVDRHDLLFFKVTEALANIRPTGEPMASLSVCS